MTAGASAVEADRCHSAPKRTAGHALSVENLPEGRRRKHAVAKRVRRSGSAIGWQDVLRALPRDEMRSLVLNRYRSAQFSPDDFEHHRAAREAMSDAMTAAEDWTEMNHPGWTADRLGMRDVRRRLEQELWP